MTRIAPTDKRLSQAVKKLVSDNHGLDEEKVILVNDQYDIIDVLYEAQIRNGLHQRSVEQAKVGGSLRAVVHFGLQGDHRAVVNVYSPDGGETLCILRFYPPKNFRWLRATSDVVRNWRKAWQPGELSMETHPEK